MNDLDPREQADRGEKHDVCDLKKKTQTLDRTLAVMSLSPHIWGQDTRVHRMCKRDTYPGFQMWFSEKIERIYRYIIYVNAVNDCKYNLLGAELHASAWFNHLRTPALQFEL